MVPLAGDGPWSQALGPTHFSWMFLDETPKGLPRVTLPDVWFVYRTNPAISFWDTAARRRADGALPVRRRVRVHARRDQPLRRRAAARRDRPREPAADPHRRHQVRRAVLGPPGLRVAPAGGGRRAARRATSPTSPPSSRERTGLLPKYNAAINKGAGGVPLKGAHGDFSLRPRARRTRATRSGTPCAGPRAPSSPTARRCTVSTGGRSNGLATRPFPRADWYLLPTLVERGLRFELPYQERLKRVGRASSAAACTSTTCTGGTSNSTEYQALPVWKDFAAPWEAAIATARRRAPATIRSGCSPRAACSTRGAATSACR